MEVEVEVEVEEAVDDLERSLKRTILEMISRKAWVKHLLSKKG